jgi:hypothetical protein
VAAAARPWPHELVQAHVAPRAVDAPHQISRQVLLCHITAFSPRDASRLRNHSQLILAHCAPTAPPHPSRLGGLQQPPSRGAGAHSAKRNERPLAAHDLLRPQSCGFGQGHDG